MFECTICGLLSLGGSACPACGSQIRVDLADHDDGSPLPSEVPGLDDAVASWNELEGIDPDDSPDEAAEPEPSASKSSLPFGFAGASNTNISRLPFGIGSFATGMPFDDSEAALPLVSEQHIEVELEAEERVQPEPLAQTRQEPAEQATVPPQAPVAARLTPVVQEQPSPTAPPPLPASQPPPSQQPPPVAQSEPQRIVPEPTPPVLPRLEATAVQVEQIPAEPEPMRLEATQQLTPQQETVAAFDADVPDMWRIDAAAPDMDQIYAQSEQVVEVVHTMEVEPTVYAHEAASFSPNSAGGVISLDLHPAQALGVSLAGMPELESTLQQGFQALSASSWAQAAIAFQKLASKMPGDAAVFNNYGLSLLQRALDMAQSTDLELQNLAMTQFESSILALREAAKSAPTESIILINLAHALLVSGRAEKAIGLVQMHDQTHPQTTISGNLHAAALVSMGESSAAKALLQRLAQDDVVRRNLERLSY
ncbi:hypothetical protein N9J16_00115 [Candidatus Poseidoniaceae archaeon]|nr:hypothetical protein [Candidatus Poseidoniaceae archaeon]